jgi:hypothetical protein
MSLQRSASSVISDSCWHTSLLVSSNFVCCNDSVMHYLYVQSHWPSDSACTLCSISLAIWQCLYILTFTFVSKVWQVRSLFHVKPLSVCVTDRQCAVTACYNTTVFSEPFCIICNICRCLLKQSTPYNRPQSTPYNRPQSTPYNRPQSTPYNRPQSLRGGVQVYFYSFFNLSTRWCGWSAPCSGHFTPGKYPVPII